LCSDVTACDHEGLLRDCAGVSGEINLEIETLYQHLFASLNSGALDSGESIASIAGAGCRRELSIPFDGSRLVALTWPLEKEGHRICAACIPSVGSVQELVEAKFLNDRN
jgi:hypothetical protein